MPVARVNPNLEQEADSSDFRAALRVVLQVEVAKQAYLGAVVDDLHAGVQDEPGHRRIGELRGHRWAFRSRDVRTRRRQRAELSRQGSAFGT